MLKNIIRNRKHLYLRCYHSENDKVRVRFAPSPTGFLHLGGLRTALYNYLFAKANNGQFILRIEDTDQSRLVPGAANQLEQDLLWAGIKIDEGPKVGGKFGPYMQSQRLHTYKKQVQILLDSGFAYYCFCTDTRLDLLRREALRIQQVPKYDNRCRHLTKQDINEYLNKGRQYCIRFKLTSDCDAFNDLIYGSISYDVAVNEGDPVIIKSDGFPTYHFANVVDDHFMEISHVLRGVEWQISTTKHLLMYRAFDWKPPIYGHLPLLLNADGTKLSKRQKDIKIGHYRENGIFPLALINFIVNSGGGFDKDLERGMKPKCFTMDQLAQQVQTINTHSGKLMPERLLEFNRLELMRKLENPDELKILVREVQNLVQNKYKDRTEDGVLQFSEDYVKTILQWSVHRIHKLDDLFSKDLSFIWFIPTVKDNVDKNEKATIERLLKILSDKKELSRDSLNKLLKSFAAENNIKYSILMKTLRGILSGLKEGPSVAEMIEILGKKNTLQRVEMFLKNNTR